MPKRSRDISEDLRKKVVEAHQSGKGCKLISKALGLSKTTVCAILRKWKRFGTVMNLPRSGRPPKVSPKTRREIIREVKKNPRLTSRDVQAALAAANITVHCSTIRKIMGVHTRPTFVGHQDVLSSDELREDVKVEKDEHELDEHDPINDGHGGAIEEKNCVETHGHDSNNCRGGNTSEKKIDSDDAESDSTDIINKYDEEGTRYDNGCGESCEIDNENDSTLQ